MNEFLKKLHDLPIKSEKRSKTNEPRILMDTRKLFLENADPIESD